MLRGALLVLCACVAVSWAASDAESIEELIQRAAAGARISDNVLEDARLDVPDLVRKYRYPIEVHTVTTADGYILEMHRIPHGRDNNNVPDKNKPTVFLMHGLFASSADYVLMGPGCGLAYILAEEGFDVWMGNARGNYYSRKHTHLNPNAILNTQFWEFSWDEIGNIDLPTMIDHALIYTGKRRLHYIGYSQGTTAFFVMTSLRPDYNQKIISMQALAPVAYMANNSNLLLVVLSQFANDIESIASIFGIGEFMPNSMIMTLAGQALCMDEVIFQPICSNIMFLIGGWNEAQHNATMLPVIMGHCPAGAAVRQLVHYAQGITDKGFRRYDHGRASANRRVYGSRQPPSYDLSRITTPVFLHYSDRDPLAHVNDVDRLFRELGRPMGKFRVPVPQFSHLDFMYGIGVRELVYDRVINLVRAMDVNAFDEDV